MLSKLAYGVTVILFIVRNLPTIIGIYRFAKTFPGITESEPLQSWCLEGLRDGATLAKATTNTIDDTVVETAISLVENSFTWSIIHSLVRREVKPSSVAFDACCRDVAEALDPEETKNPIVFLNAILLIIQIIKTFKK